MDLSPVAVAWSSYIAPVSSKEFLDIQVIVNKSFKSESKQIIQTFLSLYTYQKL